MWVKVVVCILIVAFCVLLGYLAGGKWRARKQFFEQLSVFNERYLTELNYARKPLKDFLAEYEYTGDFQKTVARFAQDRTALLEYPYLTKEERKECGDYFQMLGRGDAYSQKQFFSAQAAPLAAKRAEGEKQARSRSELYLKLGLLFGLAFIILIL